METAPVSPAQRDLWIADRVGTAGAALHTAEAVELSGAADIAALRRAVREIVRRHQVLRSTIVMVDGEPRQRVQPNWDIPVRIVDLADACSGGGNSDWLRHPDARKLVDEPFDLATQYPIRGSVFRLAPDRLGLLVVVHHIASDMMSAEILLTELSDLYGAFEKGQSSPLPELTCQYAEVAAQQHTSMTGPYLDEHVRYWQERLTNLPAPLDLALGSLRPHMVSARGAVVRLPLDEDVARAVHTFAGSERVTVFTIALAAYHLTLAAYTGDRDILVAVPSVQREDELSARLIGCFLNTLVLREYIDERLSVREFIESVWSTVTEALEYRELSYSRVIELASPPRRPGFRPLTQVGFTAAEAKTGELAFGSLRGRPLSIDRDSIAYDLMATVLVSSDALDVVFEYCVDVLNEQMVERMTQTFRDILRQMCSAPDAPLNALLTAGRPADTYPRRPAAPLADHQTPEGLGEAGQEDADPVIQRLAGLWEEALGVPEVHPEDDFFACGGHSLALIALMMKIEETFAVELPLSEVLQTPSLREQARLIGRHIPVESSEGHGSAVS
ncbi:condensation domain-containing protein [Streptomyces sp. NPDC050287]|uniref:condensation domain-containing protein n=1 Tax=Streptomyces sp. NPDC050287 TaxID=3365608 RepID=UPI0037B96759